MAENILVVEYEPRYTDRVRNALAGQPYQAWYAKDGEEAMRLLQVERPSLIVLSSVIPKIATVDLIRAVRANPLLTKTPILVTVSGYTGKNPVADAQKGGANDILPKPYSETEFIGKVHQLLGHVVTHPAAASTAGEGTLTSNEIFGDIFGHALRRPQGHRAGDDSHSETRRGSVSGGAGTDIRGLPPR
jgi:DNA-binding response OmpR family regulator